MLTLDQEIRQTSPIWIQGDCTLHTLRFDMQHAISLKCWNFTCGGQSCIYAAVYRALFVHYALHQWKISMYELTYKVWAEYTNLIQTRWNLYVGLNTINFAISHEGGHLGCMPQCPLSVDSNLLFHFPSVENVDVWLMRFNSNFYCSFVFLLFCEDGHLLF